MRSYFLLVDWRTRVTAVACREKRVKLIPPSRTVAPPGKAKPRFTEGGFFFLIILIIITMIIVTVLKNSRKLLSFYDDTPVGKKVNCFMGGAWGLYKRFNEGP